MNTRVAITQVRREIFVEDNKRSLEERIYITIKKLLKDSNRTIQDIDCISISSNDQVDGRAISIMASSGSVGGVGRDIIDAPSSGDHSLIMGYMRVLSGLYESSLIVTWSMNEVDDLKAVQNLTADPIYQRKLGIHDIAAYALQASTYNDYYGISQEAVAQIVVKNRAYACNNSFAHLKKQVTTDEILSSEYISWPLRKLMLPEISSGIVAMIIASENKIEEWGLDKESVAWIKGIGWASDSYWFDKNNLKDLNSLKSASAQAYRQANIKNPIKEINVAEIHDPTAYYELMSYEALGLCEAGKASIFLHEELLQRDTIKINPSGGALSTNPYFATGMMRVAEAALQVIGKTGDHQISNVQTSLATATSGFAGQNNSVFILSRD
ncbi:MAG: thiolase family protein [Pseudomonadota bacterium]